MKNTIFIVLLGLLPSLLMSQALRKDKSEALVKKLMSKMDLTDKVGEMTQLSIDMISVGEPYNLDEPHTLDEERLQKVLVDLRVGSILNASSHGYSREHWHEIHETIEKYTKQKKTKIPVLYGIDAIHGTNYTNGATLFPQQIGQAASWDLEMAEKIAAITAYETRASGIPWTFSPVLDLGMDPLWPRQWETYGEDVHLATEMAKAVVRGYQGEDISDPTKVVACAKHFLGYSRTLTGKDRTPAWIPKGALHEYFVPTFRAAVEEGIGTVMINSGEVNGVPVHINKELLVDLLRDELGFQGVAVTDWEDIKYLYTRHRVATDHKDAIRMAINAGIDMSMVPMDTEFPILLKELVEEGLVPMERIDESVKRILLLKARLGLFDEVFFDYEDYPNFASEESRLVSLKAAEESITLLKNTGDVLPLKEGTSIFLTGPTANSLNALNGGWTNTWQGVDPKFNTPGKKSIAEFFQENYAVNYTAVEDLAEAPSVSEDVIVLCLGEMPYTEKPGDIHDLHLPQEQYDLVNRLSETGRPIILVLNEGRPRIIRPIEPSCDAVVQTYLPGNEGAEALANILFGKVNPSGKLPYTYPRYPNSLLPYYHKGTDKMDTNFGVAAFNPQYEFGTGLSYTSFEYSNFRVDNKSAGMAGHVDVYVTLTNTGDREGKEVVQLFVTDEVASITPEVKRLRAFEKVALAAGESQEIHLKVSVRDLAFADNQGHRIVEPGTFTFRIADFEKAIEVADNKN